MNAPKPCTPPEHVGCCNLHKYAPDLAEALRDLVAWVVQLSEQSDTNALDWLNIERRGHTTETQKARAALTKAGL